MTRKVKIAAVSMALGLHEVESQQDNLDYIARSVERIASIHPDIIAIPEVFPLAGLGLEEEKIPGQGREMLCDLARKHKIYLVGSLYEKRKGRLYNSGFVINRQGRVIGRYDKIHPFIGGSEKEIAPGKKDQLPIKTEFGKVGIQICFDANWPETWQALVEKGAEIIFFPSAFPGGRILNSIALLNQVYIVPAVWSSDSGIIDNTGRWVAKTNRSSWWSWATIDLERTVFHWDFQRDKLKAIRKKYKNKLKIETFSKEFWFVLEPTTPQISISEIIREFNLISYRDYIKRAALQLKGR